MGSLFLAFMAGFLLDFGWAMPFYLGGLFLGSLAAVKIGGK